ncbi:internalin A, partial [Neptunomonas qingdaonensis]
EALTQLTSLTVSHCDALTSLSGLEALTHLTSLYLNGCNALLDYVGLDQLHNLEVLQIDARYYHQKNQHSDPSRVPWSIMKNLLLNMPQLSLSGSINMEYVPAELTHPIDQTALEDWYFEIEQQGYSNPKTLKVMLLGNGQIGKTQLVRRLRGKSFDESIPSTHGIQIHHFTPDGEDFEIKSWDFGGQDVYLGTHSLFIDNRALYLLLWHPDYENNNLVLDEQLTIRNRPLSYWLAYLKSLAGANVQVLVCQSQCDNPGDDRRAPIPHPVPLDALRETVISNKTPDGLSAFTPLFKRAVAHQLDRNGVVWIPNSWFAVEEAIQELCTQQKLLHYSDYLALCDKHHVAAPGTLANYLHQAGVVFYRKHHFDNQLILDQAWALQGIYLLLERKEALPLLSASNGKFTRDTIEQLLWRYESEYSKQDKSLFLEMMQQCGVCFKVDDDDYIAPDALPDKAYKETDIEQIWQDTDAEHHVRLHYDFLHDSTMRYLLSKIGEKAKAAACYWRYGCCYYDAKSQSKVWFDSTLLTDKEKIETGTFENYGQPGFIDIKTAGRNAEKLICHLLDSIKGVQHLEQKSRIEWQKGQPDSSQKHKGLSPESELTPFGALEPASLPPSTRSAVYFSYAWGEDTDERQQTCDQIYNKLSEENELNIYRDKNATKPGDSIAAFERKIGQADFVLLIMSEKSLYSVHCMNELRLIYERSQQQQSDFVGRVIPVVLSDAKISTRIDKFKVVEHWVSQGQELEDLINKVGLEAAGAESANERQMIRSISNCTMNALTWIGDLITERQPELQVDATIELLKKRIEEQKNRKN